MFACQTGGFFSGGGALGKRKEVRDTDDFRVELSLTVPITNSLAFLFTVLGEWWAEGKVIPRGTSLFFLSFFLSCFLFSTHSPSSPPPFFCFPLCIHKQEQRDEADAQFYRHLDRHGVCIGRDRVVCSVEIMKKDGVFVSLLSSKRERKIRRESS